VGGVERGGGEEGGGGGGVNCLVKDFRKGLIKKEPLMNYIKKDQNSQQKRADKTDDRKTID